MMTAPAETGGLATTLASLPLPFNSPSSSSLIVELSLIGLSPPDEWIAGMDFSRSGVACFMMCDNGPLLDTDVLTSGDTLTGDGVFGVDAFRPFQNSSSPSSSSSTVPSSVLSLSESNVWKLKDHRYSDVIETIFLKFPPQLMRHQDREPS